MNFTDTIQLHDTPLRFFYTTPQNEKYSQPSHSRHSDNDIDAAFCCRSLLSDSRDVFAWNGAPSGLAFQCAPLTTMSCHLPVPCNLKL